eukprot:1158551-Pelagomonas_calceolata.AAC.7
MNFLPSCSSSSSSSSSSRKSGRRKVSNSSGMQLHPVPGKRRLRSVAAYWVREPTRTPLPG